MSVKTIRRQSALLAIAVGLAATATMTVQAQALAMSPLTLPRASAAAADRDGDGLRDAFEIRWGVTDPDRRDSDRDGLPDAAEDPDDDGLGNLGEQRVSTDPTKADTDGNGRPDSRDDADRDGVQDGREQDSRPVPTSLRPRLSRAFGDQPTSYSNGCHSGAYESAIHPCVFGDTRSRKTVVVFGDSHALQWQPAMDRAGSTNAWRIIMITKSGCPSVDVRFAEPNFVGASRSCNEWRARGEAWLRAHPPELIILSNSRGYVMLDRAGDRIAWSKRHAAWAAGLTRTLGELPRAPRVLVLGDTPHHDVDPPTCLMNRPSRISACVSGRGTSLSRGHDDAERRAASRAGATFATPNGLVCSYDPCPVIVGGILMWRDKSHLTATFSRSLAPGISAIIRGALGGEAATPAVGRQPGGIAMAVSAPSPGAARGLDDSDGDRLLDAFEIRWGVTDPTSKDTDRDGLRDSAEDPDGDGLGNRGEQRSRTSPAMADTDGDGIGDGAEDADGDGRSNGAEQDRRPIPGHLTPSLRNAHDDIPPSYRDGCHIKATGNGFRACVYGRATGRTTVVLWGDSHAAQWLPALIAAGRSRDWRIVSLTRSGCPTADVITYNHALRAIDVPCQRYRDRALAWIRSERPDIVVMSNLDRYALRGRDGERIPKDRRLARWINGLGRTLEAIPRSIRTIVLADTPYTGSDVPTCLARHTRISDCQQGRDQLLRPEIAAAERRVALANGAAHVDRTDQICSYDPCPIVIDELLVYRDDSHITATYIAALGLGLGRAIDAAIAEMPAGSAAS